MEVCNEKINVFLLMVVMFIFICRYDIYAIDQDKIIEEELKVAIIFRDDTEESPFLN